MVLCDAMPNEKKRKKLKWNELEEEEKIINVDNSFIFDKRNFLARGGEVYYLHLLQALEKNEDSKRKLENLLTRLMRGEGKKLSIVCKMVQDSWETALGLSKEELTEHLSMSYIPEDAYTECGEYSAVELINYLSCGIPSINKIEILSKGMVFQIMRMMSWRASNYLGLEKNPWIVDMNKGTKNNVKKIAAEKYREIEDTFMTALNKAARDLELEEDERMKQLSKARRSSLDIFRIKGKELQCIIPTNGQFERFSLSEDIIKFLVLSLVPPKKKMTLNMFLEKLYSHYAIVIGPNEYKKSIGTGRKLEASLANSFVENVNSFQSFLKATGFLRELSDATSIVVNPYDNVLED